MVYNCKVVCYAENKQQIVFYSNDIHVNDKITERIQEKREQTKELLKDFDDDEKDNVFSTYVSERRTIKNIFKIARSNIWEYFITLTYDQKRVNRYDYDDCMMCAKEYFNYIRKNFAPDIMYMLVPEQHKDGAWHIHGLLAHIGNLKIVDSGRKDDKGRTIYSSSAYYYGWCDFTKIGSNFAAAYYMTKYVTKNLCIDTKYRNRYITSRNLHIAEEKFFRVSSDRFDKMMEKMKDILYVKTVKQDDGTYQIYLETQNNENILDFVEQEVWDD